MDGEFIAGVINIYIKRGWRLRMIEVTPYNAHLEFIYPPDGKIVTLETLEKFSIINGKEYKAKLEKHDVVFNAVVGDEVSEPFSTRTECLNVFTSFVSS
jgi:hypothetical protein